ncbi:hypothetical protein BGW38_003133, partial [Lunasporangiospora selenospora]
MKLANDILIEEIGQLSDRSFNFPSRDVTADTLAEFCLAELTTPVSYKAPQLTALLRRLNSTNRNSKITIPAILSMIQVAHNKKASFLPKVLSLFLFSSGTSRKAIETLSQIGLSVSYPSLMKSLPYLTKVKEYTAKNPFYIVYDNINIASKKYDQRLHNMDRFQNGATAAIVALESLLDTEKDSNPTRHLRLDDLIPNTENNDH